jgi:hypothetical protein
MGLTPTWSRAQMESPAPVCAITDASLPSSFASWITKVDLVSATSAADLSRAPILPGLAVTVALHATREISYPTQPEKPGGSVAHGGLLALTIAQAGTYRIALSSGAWIDLIEDGKAQASTNHGHGPPCSTIRKVVDFSLKPGLYTLEVSANASPEIGVLVTKAP